MQRRADSVERGQQPETYRGLRLHRLHRLRPYFRPRRHRLFIKDCRNK
jgi:hypothetical protein